MKLQKKLAASILKCSPYRIKLDPEQAGAIKDAITKADVRSMIHKGAISAKPITGISKGRTRARQRQKRKGRQRGSGSRKGPKTARTNKKTSWIATIRLQRAFLKKLRNKKLINIPDYHSLYLKAKGGFFRSERHLKGYLKEQGYFKK